eukprot:TRINITY_DN7982_c0_g1_i3.p1 TRINITY_DN7982_c0_g1~~TRINITY_DN7982_c0_g1_i3.p1  ORF type:complete len:132 (+),score=0.31 TRINITY_DN7982_c0_g1_i3:220-615(+)
MSRPAFLVVLLLAAAALHAEAKTVVVGKGVDFASLVNPWNAGVNTYWQPPTVVPGDTLVFRWFGRREVQQWPTMVGYNTCWFYYAKVLTGPRYFGMYRYTVKSTDQRTVLYFGSNVGDDCARDVKVAIPIS